MLPKLNRRETLAGLGGALLTTALPISSSWAAGKFEGKTLNTQYWSGSEGNTIRTAVVDPFIKETGANVIVTEGNTTLSLAKMKAERSSPTTSVYLLDEVGVITAEREGLLSPLDFSAIPNALEIDPKFIVKTSDGAPGKAAGIGFFTYLTTLVYNTDIIKEPPTSWSALWDPAYAGRLAVPSPGDGSSYQLAMIAAMLNGGDQYNMDAAWPALERLAGNVDYMDVNTAILAELIKSGDVVLAMRLPYYFKEYIEKGYPIGIANQLTEGIFAFTASVCMVKDHPDDREVCDAFVNELLSARAQTDMANIEWFGPTNKNVVIAPEISSNLLHTPEQWESIIPIDIENLSLKRQEWIEKYTRSLL